MKSAITVSLVEEALGGPFVYWNGLAHAVQHASALGFDAIEIFPPDPSTFDRRGLRELLDDCPLRVAAFGTGAGWVKHKLQLADASPVQRRKGLDFIRSTIDLGAEFGAAVIIGSMQGRSSPEVGRVTARGLLREGLEELGEYSAEAHVMLLYEPLNRYETDQANTLEQGAQLIDGLAGIKLLADWFHMNIEESDMAAALVRFGSAIGHIHFADSNRSAVGLGHLDVVPLIEALRSISYTGYLSAEVFPKPDSEQAARTSIESFRRLTKEI